MILLDTHVLLWSRFGSTQIGVKCRRAIEQALEESDLAISAFSFWEIAMLRSKGRMDLLRDIGSWRRDLLESGLIEIPVNGEIGIRAYELPDFHADPADRIIVATALDGHLLLTADDRILEWRGDLNRLDARV